MKKYEIWMEGYAASGDRSGALFMGEIQARSYDEACITLLKDDLDKNDESTDGYKKTPDGKFTIWGCRLFDNEKDARISFG